MKSKKVKDKQKNILADIKNYSFEIVLITFSIVASVAIGISLVYPLWLGATKNSTIFSITILAILAILILISTILKLKKLKEASQKEKQKALLKFIFSIINLVVIYALFIFIIMKLYLAISITLIVIIIINLTYTIIKSIINNKWKKYFLLS